MGASAGSQYLLEVRPRQLVYEFLHLLRAANGKLESRKKGGRSHPTLQASKCLRRCGHRASRRPNPQCTGPR